ncbi:MAG: hypothetical protein AAFW82_02620 [Pseudomonadota bacterium]
MSDESKTMEKNYFQVPTSLLFWEHYENIARMRDFRALHLFQQAFSRLTALCLLDGTPPH